MKSAVTVLTAWSLLVHALLGCYSHHGHDAHECTAGAAACHGGLMGRCCHASVSSKAEATRPCQEGSHQEDGHQEGSCPHDECGCDTTQCVFVRTGTPHDLNFSGNLAAIVARAIELPLLLTTASSPTGLGFSDTLRPPVSLHLLHHVLLV